MTSQKVFWRDENTGIVHNELVFVGPATFETAVARANSLRNFAHPDDLFAARRRPPPIPLKPPNNAITKFRLSFILDQPPSPTGSRLGR
jgi:hypothetical protein